MEITVSEIGLYLVWCGFALVFAGGAFMFLFMLGMMAFKKPQSSLFEIFMNGYLIYSHIESYVEEKHIPKLKGFYKKGGLLWLAGFPMAILGTILR